MLRYAITDASRTAADRHARREALLTLARRWSAEGIDFVQLREKSLTAGELFDLASELRLQLGGRTRLLVNSRVDIALATGADGVHLTALSGELTPGQIRKLFARAGRRVPIISVSCHSPETAARASAAGVDVILFSPVFEKVVGTASVSCGGGLGLLAHATQAAGTTPVLALGGVSPENTEACLAAGAAGVAGIRLFA